MGTCIRRNSVSYVSAAKPSRRSSLDGSIGINVGFGSRMSTHQATLSNTRPFYTQANEMSMSNFGKEMMSPSISMNLDFSSPIRNIQLQQQQYPREIVFLGGAPGSGKGTNSRHIANLRKFDAPTIVVSDLLNTPACKLLKDRGIMVDDDFVFKTLLKELEKPIYRNGVVVDGFPRTTKQIDFIKNFHDELDCTQQSPPNISFVMLNVDETTSINRQQARGKEALMLFNAQEVRATDLNIEASKLRYTLFKEQLNTMMTRLSNEFPLIVVDASHPLDIVKADIAREISQQLDMF